MSSEGAEAREKTRDELVADLEDLGRRLAQAEEELRVRAAPYDPFDAEKIDLLATLATMSRYAEKHYQGIARWMQEKDRLRRWARAWKRDARKLRAEVVRLRLLCPECRGSLLTLLTDGSEQGSYEVPCERCKPQAFVIS